MNLRNIQGEYNIGLDMGTGSVGWAVTDEKGTLLHFKKQPTWGSRLFDNAMPASEARVHRGQRRRYIRRRWRLNLLQGLFAPEMDKVDPDFFNRLNHSRELEGDPIFNGSDFTKADYYDKFPTIYHLRKWLMETDEKADIRLVYLALHNIVKHRGNFLREGQQISSEGAKPDEAFTALRKALEDWCDECDNELKENRTSEILEILADVELRPSDKKKAIAPLVGVMLGEDAAASKKCNETIAGAVLGLKAEFKNVFGELSCDTTNISLSNDEAVESLREACPDEGVELFDAICNAHSAYLLQGLLSYASGKSISANMIAKYEQYGEDLKILKDLVREYMSKKKYDEVFRGPFYEGTSIYDASKAQGYTKYNLGTSKLDYDAFAKEVEKLLGKTDAKEDPRYLTMMESFGKQKFLRRLKTSDNGSIYYQLHLEELQAICDNQARFYPFLKDQKEKLEKLVSFRIPYYVGPLQDNDAPRDKKGNRRFSWAERKPGMEGVAITPWNWDEVIDRNGAAEKFIKRMTGMCTYLQGQDVLPKCSLLYEEFCVLNELNGLKVSVDGDREHRLDAAQREGIIDDLFHRYKTVSYKRIEDWIKQNEGLNARVSGGQGVSGLESKMSSYIFFAKDIFGVDELDRSDYPMIEEIVLWNTLFEDRKILKEKLEEKYGSKGNGSLNDEQIKKICKKRFAGWGRLSEKFLTGLKAQTDCGPRSIMDVLREGDPNATVRRGRSMVLMEILRDDELRFQGLVDEFNKQCYGINGKSIDVNELPGSPAIRRSLNQAIRIVDEIAKIAGKAPKNIFVEVTRDEDPRNKGRRTKRRYDQLKDALASFKGDAAQLKKELGETKPADLEDERLMLYFAQGGKCLYSGRAIDINQLNAGLYEVDHIIPRSYIKDDSLENKALVLREANQRKTDAMLLDSSVRTRMSGYWRSLHDAGLIGDKKYRNLLRSEITEGAMKGFVARQLVETSQMVKLVQTLLDARYPDTQVVPVKASISHDLREAAGFVKCREANDYHHAHDAFIACRVGLFIQMRHPKVYENPIAMTHAMKAYARQQAKIFNSRHEMPGSSGFIVNSFMTSGFDKETGEIFKDEWDAEKEVEGIRKALNYRQCYITRMPYEDTGRFWDATIYSPRDAKMGPKLALSLKDNLDPKQYGGYSSQQFAYFFVYEARKPKKKDQRLFRFEAVPVWLASRINGDPDALAVYAKELAEKDGLEFVRIERARILKRQLIEIDASRLFITGLREIRNGKELGFNQNDCELLQSIGSDNCKISDADERISHLFNRIVGSMHAHSPRLDKQLNMKEYSNAFGELTRSDKGKLVLDLVKLLNGNNRVVNLKAVGGSANAGAMVVNCGNLISNPDIDFYIIDQSVTGMFERKTRIGL